MSRPSFISGRFSISVPTACWREWARCIFPTCPGSIRERWRSALPLGDPTKNIVSYAIYAAELAVSIVVLARVIGFSWLMATVAAQLYLYLLFPPFSEVFRIYDWYSLAPYYAHLQAVLNGAAALLLVCGRPPTGGATRVLAAGFLALFISGLLSAPFTFVFATPAYVAICAALILTRRPSRAEWAWKIAALALCLMFFFASGPSRLLSRHDRHGRPHADGRRSRGTGSSPPTPGCSCSAITRYAAIHGCCCASTIAERGC